MHTVKRLGGLVSEKPAYSLKWTWEKAVAPTKQNVLLTEYVNISNSTDIIIADV